MNDRYMHQQVAQLSSDDRPLKVAAVMRFCVYRHYDARNVLLYVGSTGNLGARTGNHRRSAEWWDLTALVTITRYPTESEMLAAERQAIADEGPMFNVSRARPASVTRAMAEALRAQSPDMREKDIAKALGISGARLRAVRQK